MVTVLINKNGHGQNQRIGFDRDHYFLQIK